MPSHTLTLWGVAVCERAQVALFGNTRGRAGPATNATGAVARAPITQHQGEVGGQAGLAWLLLARPSAQCGMHDEQKSFQLGQDNSHRAARPLLSSSAQSRSNTSVDSCTYLVVVCRLHASLQTIANPMPARQLTQFGAAVT